MLTIRHQVPSSSSDNWIIISVIIRVDSNNYRDKRGTVSARTNDPDIVIDTRGALALARANLFSGRDLLFKPKNCVQLRFGEESGGARVF